MKIGILGCGYVGQAVAKKWTEDGHEVIVSTRKPERISELKKVSKNVFILQPGLMKEFLQPLEALLVSVAPSRFASIEEYQDAYLSTAQNLLRNLANCPQLQQIIYTSAISVYGDLKGGWADETSAAIPNSKHAEILYDTEKFYQSMASPSLNVCIFRLGDIYGPGREFEGRMHRMQGKILPGTGENYTNMVHLSDIVSAINFALNNNLEGIYNLCNDFHVPVKPFYNEICRKEKLPPVQWDPTKESPYGGDMRISSQKIKDLGFIFTENAPDGTEMK